MISNIPEEIRKLKPVNTRIKKQGNTYLVIKRTSRRIDGKNIPIELGVIGHIKLVDGGYRYIAKELVSLKANPITTLEFGYTNLIDRVNKTILEELEAIYPKTDALKIYILALLRVAYTNISRDIKLNYKSDFISKVYPNIRLDDSHLSTYYEEVGKRPHMIYKFMRNRISNGSGRYIIDGMLKTNDSFTNSYSEYSRKGSKKGRKDISLIYAYDINTKEPVASKNYPGNMLDQTSFIDFINTVELNKGILIMDKGFHTKDNLNILKTKKELKYLLPIKRSDSRITDLKLNKNYTSILPIKDKKIFCKKTILSDSSFLYSFMDLEISKIEAKAYLSRHENEVDILVRFKRKEDKFGLIVFESNLDIECIDIYNTYDERWELELVFKYYQSLLDLDTLRVKGDIRLQAIEFINFLSTLMTLKLKKYYKTLSLDKKYSYDEIKHFLFKLKANTFTPEDINSYSTNKVVKYLDDLFNILGVKL